MVLLVLEAFGALALLLLIVWWTMFSGRNKGELAPPPASADTPQAAEPAKPAPAAAAETPPTQP